MKWAVHFGMRSKYFFLGGGGGIFYINSGKFGIINWVDNINLAAVKSF